MLGVLLLSVLLSVRLTVLLSYQGNDLYTSVQKAVQGIAAGDDDVKQSGIHGFWMSIAIFSVLATLYVIRFMVDIYLTQRFIIAWRVWLTAHLTDDWLDGRAYYRDLFIDNTIDNPDQRIQQDVDIFTADAGGTPNIPSNGTGKHLAVRCRQRGGLGDLVRRDPVEPVRGIWISSAFSFRARCSGPFWSMC